MVIPVAKLLQQFGFSVKVLGLTIAAKVVEDAQLPCLTMRNFLRPRDKRAREWGEKLALGQAKNPDVPWEETVAYLGLSYDDLIESVGLEEAERRFRQYGRQTFLPVRLMQRVLAQVNPSVVVTTSSPRAERAAILAAGLTQIPSVCMVDLFIGFELEWLKEHNYANKICVLNSYVAQKLINAGRVANQICVTGNPAFDSINTLMTIEKGHQLRKLRNWNDKTVVLWVSQVEPLKHPAHPNELGDTDLPAKILRNLRSICQSDPDMILVIRPHPVEVFDSNSIYLKDNEVLSFKSEDIASLLHAVDVVVVMTSTVGLEAHMANATVVQVTGSLYTSDAPYKIFGIADFECSPDDLSKIMPLANEMACSRRNSLIDTSLSNIKKESATHNVAKVIKELYIPS